MADYVLPMGFLQPSVFFLILLIAWTNGAQDLADMIRCHDDTECPADSLCSMGNICLCISLLQPAKKDGSCPSADGNNCGLGKHLCNDSLCVDDASLCKQIINCGDRHDMLQCGTNGGTTLAIPADTEDEDGVTWLKTTVYTVIACTVGVVLFISVIVIAIFRMKMKRSAYRRALHQSGARRGARGRRSHRSNAGEEESFISSPTSSHFGNIIVNVNNGVQYVPYGDFNAVIQTPPTYAEVLAENRQHEFAAGRASPPPEYCTVDRNPNRLSSPGDNVNLETVTHCMETTAVTTDRQIRELPNEPLSSSTRSCEDSPNDRDTDREDNITRFSDESAISDATVPPLNYSVIETNSVERTSCSSQDNSRNGRDRHSESAASPNRPKQLTVRNGQIVLGDSSSESSSPETVTRNTQTCTSDITRNTQTCMSDITVACEASSKAGQIEVQGGQIRLTSQAAQNLAIADTGVSLETEHACYGQGQLEVKDGQIVFKAS